MARILPIVKIVQSGGVGTPARITVAGNLVSSFQGKFYRKDVAPFTVAPFYSSPTAPSSYSTITATTFDIVGNSSYNGRYTVYTPTSSSDPNPSSVLNVGNTDILVNEVVGAFVNASDTINTGSVTNISTYVIAIEGETSLVVPPSVIMSDRPMDIIGRNGTPWAESYTQNFIKLAQNFAGGAAPINPYLGQTWYDDSTNSFNLRTPSGWTAIASGIAGSNTTFRFTKSAAATSWVVVHNLGLVAPFVALTQIFVDTGGGVYKMIFPSDMNYDSTNQLTITFTTPQAGVVLIRA